MSTLICWLCCRHVPDSNPNVDCHLDCTVEHLQYHGTLYFEPYNSTITLSGISSVLNTISPNWFIGLLIKEELILYKMKWSLIRKYICLYFRLSSSNFFLTCGFYTNLTHSVAEIFSRILIWNHLVVNVN